jgi:hypothetical protein
MCKKDVLDRRSEQDVTYIASFGIHVLAFNGANISLRTKLPSSGYQSSTRRNHTAFTQLILVSHDAPFPKQSGYEYALKLAHFQRTRFPTLYDEYLA